MFGALLLISISDGILCTQSIDWAKFLPSTILNRGAVKVSEYATTEVTRSRSLVLQIVVFTVLSLSINGDCVFVQVTHSLQNL